MIVAGRPVDACALTGAAEQTAPWPLLAAARPRLGAGALARVARLGDALARTPEGKRSHRFLATLGAAGVTPGWSPGPTLWIEDHRGIELIAERIACGFEYRSLGLARDGDVLLLSRRRDRAFERHLRDTLGLGAPRVLRVASDACGRRTLARSCLADADALAVVVALAREGGGLNIVPFRGEGHVWELARAVARAATTGVRVAAAPPPLARAANDKVRFVAMARRLFSRDALPPSWSAHGTSAAAARLAHLARHHKRLVLKTPSSAGARGNVVIEAAALRGLSLRKVRTRVVEALDTLGWIGPWPILVGVWEEAVLASPSVQSWIPPMGAGEPVIEGVYEQRLVGERGTFVGATETTLDRATREPLELEAFTFALLLQRLGYAGRASLDALLVGPDWQRARRHWIECNARWGGVSIPMCVLRRLGIGPNARDTLIAQAPHTPRTKSFQQTLAATADLAYERSRCRGVIWLTPPDEGRPSIDFVAVGAFADESGAIAAQLRRALAELGDSDGARG